MLQDDDHYKSFSFLFYFWKKNIKKIYIYSSIFQYRFQGDFAHGQGVSHTFHHSYLRTHFIQLHQSTTLLLPTREEAVQPGMSGASGSSIKNLSNSLLNFSTVHPFRSLMFLGRELNNFTDFTKKLSSLIVFNRVDAVRHSSGSLNCQFTHNLSVQLYNMQLSKKYPNY